MSVSPVAAPIRGRRELHRAVPLYRAIPGARPSRRANAASTRPSGGDIFTEQLEGHFHWTATVAAAGPHSSRGGRAERGGAPGAAGGRGGPPPPPAVGGGAPARGAAPPATRR